MHLVYSADMPTKPVTEKPTGPRGGKTTLTPGGLLKKTVYLESEEWEALRKRSFLEQRPISELIRSLIREGLGLDLE
jgi:hypothetical protein